jgi:hypothetical protein
MKYEGQRANSRWPIAEEPADLEIGDWLARSRSLGPFAVSQTAQVGRFGNLRYEVWAAERDCRLA